MDIERRFAVGFDLEIGFAPEFDLAFAARETHRVAQAASGVEPDHRTVGQVVADNRPGRGCNLGEKLLRHTFSVIKPTENQ